MQLDAITIAELDGYGAEPGERHFTDLGNAELLVEQHGDDLLYCHPWAKWLCWDGQRWSLDDTGELTRRAKGAIRSLLRNVDEIADSSERLRLVKHANASESEPRVRAMLTLARSEVPVLPDELDADPWLLNVTNGTLDLRTGELRPPKRSDRITKLAPVEYDPDAECPTWDAFLERIFAGSADKIGFLQRALGYSVTGLTNEQVLFILWGAGANGKSTLIETIRAALGDYGMQTPPDTLLDRRDGVPNDVARLKGARFVAATETGEGRRLDEAVVKRLTGGDSIAARFMRGEWFEFRPAFALWLATNHKPQIRGADEAIWRRIRLVPFTVTIPPDERDPELPAQLRDELPGIFAWIVRGCLTWQREGLGQPAEVLEATQSYRDEMDTLGAFLADRCVEDANASVATASLYSEYKLWSDANGERAISKKLLGMRLADRGFEPARTGSGRGWKGLGLQSDEALWQQANSAASDA